jgi:hypothetical protein
LLTKTKSTPRRIAMNQFITNLSDKIKGVLTGLDRVVFRGTIRSLCYPLGVEIYMRNHQILHKDFGKHVEMVSQQVTKASLAAFHAQGGKEIYLSNNGLSKEEIARKIQRDKGIHAGTICILTAVEPCLSFEMYRNAQTKQLELQARMRKCKHIYHYVQHPLFGFMNVRLQTWFPFRVQICINGREWLANQMDTTGMGYVRADNCFPWVESFQAAQSMLHQQLEADYPALLDAILLTAHPMHDVLKKEVRSDYYWSCYQSEWATDVVFAESACLDQLYPRLIQHGMTTLSCTDVLRFLGKPVTIGGEVRKDFRGEVTSDLKSRTEGVRIKHYVDGNSVKMYDKARTPVGCVLRLETTVNHPEEFYILRPKEGGPAEEKTKRYLRKGVVDLAARAQISQECNDRYMTALASVDNDRRLNEMLVKVTLPAVLNQKRIRALRPFDPEDMKLLKLVSRGDFILNGVRNSDLQRLWFDEPAQDKTEARRRSGFITRKLRMLRAHGIVEKVAGSHRYQVTEDGRKILTAILAASETPVNRLLPLAA